MFIRGYSPFLERPSSIPGMVDDLKTIASLSDEEIQGIRKHLAKADRFLDLRSLLTSIHEVIQDRKSADAVGRAIRNLMPSDVERIIGDLKQAIDEEHPPCDEDTLTRLTQALGELIQPYPALVRYRKAERLAKTTGQQLETVELICDLRPIFDRNREKLEGMMPYTRLHIIATGEDGLPKSFEAELTYEQVVEVAEKAKKAKGKLDVLGQSIETWLPGRVPNLPLTRGMQKGPSDV